MKGADKIVCQIAAVCMLCALSSAPANAQFGVSGGGGEDMMTKMAPMLEMMKAKMGKRRFAMMMQTMGPMMGQMMQGGGGGFGGMMPGGGTGFAGAGGNIMGMQGGGAGGMDIMSMIGPMMQMVDFSGGSLGGHRRHRRHK